MRAQHQLRGEKFLPQVLSFQRVFEEIKLHLVDECDACIHQFVVQRDPEDHVLAADDLVSCLIIIEPWIALGPAFETVTLGRLFVVDDLIESAARIEHI